MDELSYEAFFLEQNYTITVPENLNVEMPENVFNVINMYVFNGEVCNIGTAQNVYWKRNYFTAGKGYLAKNNENNERDPFHITRSNNPRIFASQHGGSSPLAERGRTNTFFFNIQNGTMMLSESCKQFSKIFFTASTIPDIENDPVIPRYLHRAIVLWVAREAIVPRLGENPRFSAIFAALDTDLNGRSHESDGAWYKAIDRPKQMDAKTKEDLSEYWQRMYY